MGVSPLSPRSSLLHAPLKAPLSPECTLTYILKRLKLQLKEKRDQGVECVCSYMHTYMQNLYDCVHIQRQRDSLSMDYLCMAMYIAWAVRNLCRWKGQRPCSKWKALINKQESGALTAVFSAALELGTQRIAELPCDERRGVVAGP